ncbi:hypothetical protein TWF569_011157 [Orbilia oligospora]|uniref:Uncharacterized protein n=1 Tax=Orbilia oligospora TaxID=2813651 RepID=A0A7C8N6Y7_ORBOL|nr:hypothetical protein TWF103_011799 [Orbilia oligospora]KAF3103457.1 hypothetical protein TWF102_003649 [Orbilia oligospora]KAF3131533.1 hypothetical protein TWF569_011157 [Orbilia oligospora]KAF3131578.1 hypothetical protein TWF703_007589 [Orbilia oligospora]KAF3152317.1 hypothetical protein TWF594_004017 [Orbilia oligospora]
MPSRSESKSTRRSRKPSQARTVEVRDERRDIFTHHKRRNDLGVLGRLQGVEDIVFGAVGELGRAILGDKRGARKSAEVFEEGIDTLFGYKNTENPKASGPFGRGGGADISLLRDTYFEGYDAGIHAGLSRAEAEASWYSQPRQISDYRATINPKSTFGNAKALKRGPDSELES